MNKLIMSAVSAAALLTATAAFAAPEYSNGPDANIVQTGDHNGASVTQTNGASTSDSNQNGAYNSITVSQVNGASTSLIGQGETISTGFFGTTFKPANYTTGATANVSQTGGNQSSTIQQFDSATAYVTQVAADVDNGHNYGPFGYGSDNGNSSSVIQSVGSANALAQVSQYGDNNSSTVAQSGNTDKAIVYQGYYAPSSGDTSTVTQSGAFETAYVTQTGANDNSWVNQAGSYNTADVVQNAKNAQSSITQSGLGNSATVRQ